MNTTTNYPGAGQGQQPYPAPPPYTAVSQPQTGYEASSMAATGVMQYASQPTAPPAEQQAAWQQGQASSSNQFEKSADGFVAENAPERRDNGPSKPTDKFEPIPGYERHSVVDYDTVLDIPPPAYEPPSQDIRPAESFSSPDLLTEKEVRDAMLTFVSLECCYGSRPAKQMDINNIGASSGLHYQLESFTEARHTNWEHCPYHSGPVDGPNCGRAPLPWDIDCQPSELFKDHQKEVAVPHTSYVKQCFKCNGFGKITCGKCCSQGKVTCNQCGGLGRYGDEKCDRCRGKGKIICSRCDGSGHETCPICTGTGQLQHYLNLTVKFTNHLSDYILEESDMPAELIRDVSGQVIFEQALPHIWPVTQYPVKQINDNSVRIVNEHQQAWPQERTIMQHHILRSVPVSEVAYTWKDVNTRFWVYGFEHKVYAPDYPHKCCWGCNVL